MQSKETLKIRRETKLPFLDRVALALLFLYLLSFVMGGAFRYYSVQFGLPLLPYLPRVLLMCALAPMFFAYLAREGITSTYLIVLVFFSSAAIYGVFNLGNPSQVEFGLWTLVPFLYGIVVLPSFLRSWRRLVPYAIVLWALAIAGVLINIFHTWPWIGFEYQVAGAYLHASRLWQYNDLDIFRLPGFSEASFFAGPQILLLALFLKEGLSKRWWVPAWVLSGLAIFLTTSKTPLVIFIIFSVLWILFHGEIRPSWRLMPMVAACLDIVVPFSMMLISTDWLAVSHSNVYMATIGSFVERMEMGWPVWIRMIVSHGSFVFGRGMGGIGSAQQHFEPWLFSPSDNMAVYVYAIFGLLGLALMLLYGWRASRTPSDGPIGRFFFYMACAVMMGGATLSVMDAPLLGLVFGASLRYFVEKPVRLRQRVNVSRREAIRPIRQRNPEPEGAA